ncbi:hypothetical protein MHZ92_14400 [Sporosarcina sp. ACRSL]|uniref:hypothetical protein n=1 Tax=Sporosarcina sp. ACRSL TaxID=2918215 RepID=UPI001EF5993C|nr:hypothetical protein [Sporosarcina sp. ACRSL]MCG7345327.1 hypothetical protein [Sporosarcina sp. ACRSL]
MTRKQREAFDAVFIRGQAQNRVAGALGVSEPALTYRLSASVVKLAAVLEAWDYLDGTEALTQ